MLSNVRFAVFLFPLTFVSLFNSYAQGGLQAAYFNDIELKDHVLSRVEDKPYLNGYLESPAPGVNQEYFSVRWTGKLTAPATGQYTFFVTADDGVRLWINNKKIIDAWLDQEASHYSGSISLEKGKLYDLKIEYYNSILHCVFKLTWENPEDTYNFLGYTLYTPETEVPANVYSVDNVDKDINQNPKTTLADVVAEKQVDAVTPVASNPVSKKQPSTKASAKAEQNEHIAINEPIELKSVHFEQTKYDLLPDAYDELNTLFVYLRKHPHLSIKIIGHTDYAGDSIANRVLSEQRANAVADYFKRQGLDAQRILVAGMGSAQPRIIRDEANARRENRRVEFVLLDTKNIQGTSQKK